MKSHAITVGPGRVLDITAPDTLMVKIDDIALSLSRKCRFGGFSREWFSVAQHSWNVAMHLRAFGWLAALPGRHRQADRSASR